MKQPGLAMCGLLAGALIGGAAQAAAGSLPVPPPEVAGIPVVLLVDMGAGQTLFAREAERRFLPASLTKVMTAYTALERVAAGKLRLDQRLTVRPETQAAWAGKGTSMLLKPGESVPVDALLRGITAVSANNASVVLAEGVAGSVPAWAATMNRDAKALGFDCSRFSSPNGWPDGGATYVCARDLVKLADALIERHPQAYARYFAQPSFAWNGAIGDNRNPLLGAVPGADGIKTGHTREAGYNLLGSAERNGRRLVLVLAGATSEAQRASAARALVEWGFSAWRSRPLFEAGARVGSARVQEGSAREVGLVAGRAIRFATPTADDRLTASITYQGPLRAPIAKGDEVAKLRLVSASGAAAEVPLHSATSVEKAGPWDRLLNGLAAWFG